MRWHELERFRDASVAKLDNLRRAARAGVRVPRTHWTLARDVPAAGSLPPPAPGATPWMVRSASPEEDGVEGSAAGRFHSERVPAGADLGDAVRRVVASLTRDAAGAPRGAVFAQPFAEAERAGVAFFDGFHYERTWAPGDNFGLTSGATRGIVERGDLVRGEPWSRWLERVAAVFPELDRVDLEWAEDAAGFVLLQARRAKFEVRGDPLVSVANHREILGEAPSPWIVSALDEAGRAAFGWFGACDPAIDRWGERYARMAAGRAWMDFSAFFRVMDRWGLPRTFVTQGVGGAASGPLDSRVVWGRFLRSGPRLLRLQLANVRLVLGVFRELARVERAVRAAEDLAALHAATALGLATALRVNFALGGALAGVQRVRRALGVRGGAHVVTGDMGHAYEDLRRLPSEERGRALDAWLEQFGHRGPLESDPLHPRFDELRTALEADLAGEAPSEEERAARGGRGPLFWFERRRETFRDELMKVWRELRRRLVAEGTRLSERGELAKPDDVFFLTRTDLDGASPPGEAARANRASWEGTRHLALPHTARLSRIEALARAGEGDARARPQADAWSGIGLTGEPVEGRVRRAEDLASFLRDGAAELGRGDVLVVPALEPSWGVLFGRVGAVVAELGGELSHASILLRELGTPSVVNCLGCWGSLRDGERVRVDPRAGRVERSGGAAGKPRAPVTSSARGRTPEIH